MRPWGKKEFPSICSGKEGLRPCKVTRATRWYWKRCSDPQRPHWPQWEVWTFSTSKHAGFGAMWFSGKFCCPIWQSTAAWLWSIQNGLWLRQQSFEGFYGRVTGTYLSFKDSLLLTYGELAGGSIGRWCTGSYWGQSVWGNMSSGKESQDMVIERISTGEKWVLVGLKSDV